MDFHVLQTSPSFIFIRQIHPSFFLRLFLAFFFFPPYFSHLLVSTSTDTSRLCLYVRADKKSSRWRYSTMRLECALVCLAALAAELSTGVDNLTIH